MSERITVRPTGVVAGGDAIARDVSGAVVFVAGAIPGELVEAEVVEERRGFRRAAVLGVLEASPDRTAPPCPNVAAGCGGCGWQHVRLPAQRAMKVSLVRDALVRIAKLDEAVVPPLRTAELPAQAYRTTIRVAVAGGRAHYHRAGSSDLVDAAGCWIAHPLVAELVDEGHFGAARVAVVRAGVASADRAALLTPTASGARLPPDVEVVDARDRAARGSIREVVDGRLLQASIRSFFQASPHAAEALVREVTAGLGDHVQGAVADLYAGVGLFAGAAASRGARRVVAVERDRSAVADARVNLRGAPANVVRAEVGRWRPRERFDAVVADPARPGLGRPGTTALLAADPRVAVLVSCDAASFARDVGLLVGRGFVLAQATLVDAFPHTPHVEIVSVLARGGSHVWRS